MAAIPRASAFLALLIVFGGIAAAMPAAPALAEPCPGFAFVPGQGPSCPTAGGMWEVLLADASRVATHGPDPVPDGPHVAAAFAERAPPACADLPHEYAGVLLYVVPMDRPDRHAELEDELRDLMHRVNGLLRLESSEFGVALDYRMRCDLSGQVRVDRVVLPTAAADTTFSTILNDLRARGYTSVFEKYWIWFDGQIDCGCGGQGTFRADHTLRPDNANNLGPSYGVTYGYLSDHAVRVLMHENGHNLGAVLPGAPDSSGAGHCNDGQDIMCYGDGGPTSAYDGRVCTDRMRFDCHHDTYFNPSPDVGSFVSRSWNLGLPLNNWIQGCMRVDVALNPQVPVSLDVPAACAGHRYAAYGAHSLQRAHACWFDTEGATLACDEGDWRGAASVPDGAARVELLAPRVGGPMTLSVF